MGNVCFFRLWLIMEPEEKDSKRACILADTCIAHKNYWGAQGAYDRAYYCSNSTVRRYKVLSDSLRAVAIADDKEKSKIEGAKYRIKRIKDAGVVDLLFNEKGEPTAYKKSDGIEKKVSLLTGNTLEIVMQVTKADWEKYK